MTETPTGTLVLVTDEMVESAARAIDHAYNPDRAPILAAMFRDYARAALEAAAPQIAATALRQFADSVRMPWTVFLRRDGSPVTVGDLLRERATSLESIGKEAGA